jgi:ferritin-like metal-binding protein YciE
MPSINSLHDLMIHQLRDLYSAEKQLVQALPKMARNANAVELQDAIRAHLAETEEHVSRLEQAFEMLGVTSRGMKCKGMEGLIEEGQELFEEEIEPEVLDAGIIAAAQRIEHYEIAGYGTVCEFARSMGHDELLSLLDSTLAEEKQTDETLTSLAEAGINAMADKMGEENGSDDESESDEEGEQNGAMAKSAARKGATARQDGGRQGRESTKRASSKKANR